MPNTYTQIYIQFVFTVKYRNGVIEKHWKDQLYKYITGTVNALGHKLIAINGVEDHIHILVGYKPVQSFSDLMKAVKQNSSKWINENNLTKRKFEWQEGLDCPQKVRHYLGVFLWKEKSSMIMHLNMNV